LIIEIPEIDIPVIIHLLFTKKMVSSTISAFKEKMNRMSRCGQSFLFVIDYKLRTGMLIPTAECASREIFYDIEGISNFIGKKSTQNIVIKKHPVAYQVYLKAFQHVQEEIRKGNSYLTNLTFSTPIEANASLSEIFHCSSARYRLLFKDQFFGFSPESFVKIADGKISTFPMKGTIDASIENAAELLLNNTKEAAEHATVVDLLRNDLSIVASDVRVEKYRYIEKIKTSGKSLLQMSSVVSGDLPSGYKDKLADIIISLLPAGSICGAPKRASLKIIGDAEKYERGFYTGIFGIFDGVNLNSGVMIRYIENQNGQLVYKSGGGITAKSNPLEEYQELIDKIYVPVD
jgi:para-aminobenzoate synthetase component 1